MALFDEAAKLGKASEDVFNGGGGLIMEDFLNEWVAKGVASNLNDFIVDPRVIFFLNICM